MSYRWTFEFFHVNYECANSYLPWTDEAGQRVRPFLTRNIFAAFPARALRMGFMLVVHLPARFKFWLACPWDQMPGGSGINGKERPSDAESQIVPGNYAIRRPSRRRRCRCHRHHRSDPRKQLLEQPFPVLRRKIKRFRRRMESSPIVG